MSHTPGPWRLEASWLVTPEYDHLLYLGECTDADAFLIAAAPDLLAACQAALGFCWKSTNDNPAKMLERAIAKAEKHLDRSEEVK